MKKYLFMTLAVVAVTSLFLVSCSSSDDNNSVGGGNIVGTWKWDSFNSDETEEFFGEQYVQFKSDGTFIEVDIGGSGSDKGKVEIMRGQWEKTDNIITIRTIDASSANNPTTQTEISKLTETDLTIITLGITMSYKRVSDSDIEKYL